MIRSPFEEIAVDLYHPVSVRTCAAEDSFGRDYGEEGIVAEGYGGDCGFYPVLSSCRPYLGSLVGLWRDRGGSDLHFVNGVVGIGRECNDRCLASGGYGLAAGF